jgi:uncharacterized protein YndB with AHSA1/START domain
VTVSINAVPVRKSVVVDASAEEAFETFTGDVDSWWPRTHHISKSPMTRIVIEGRAEGRCYTEHEDGSVFDWGRVLAWDPPHRLVLAWQMTHEWAYEPELSRSSEVEVRFVPMRDDTTRVEVEHRFFERHGEGAAGVRGAVDAPNGWTLVMARFADRVNASVK